MTSKQLQELSHTVYDITINPDPKTMMEALFNLRDALDAVVDHLYHREVERENRR